MVDDRMTKGAPVGVSRVLTIFGGLTPCGAVANAANAPSGQQGLRAVVISATQLCGTPQGLAVHVDGLRISQAFNDSVNRDLISPAAVPRVEAVGSNAVCSLDARAARLPSR